MAFGIPNQGDAGNALQAEPDSVDIDILVAAYSGSGIVSGCAVTAQGTPDMTVAVASGVVIVAGVRAAVTGANSTIGTADTTNPRFDLITVNSSGTIATTAGTAAAIPEFPAIPANSVVIAAVFVAASDTTISSSNIVDKRAILLNGCAAGPGDDVIFRAGADGDVAYVMRSTALTATTTLANVVEGTAATLGTAANSLIISNITNDGDIHLIVSKAGNSHTAFLADGSTGDTYVNAATGQVVNLSIAATAEVAVSGSAIYPVTDDGQTLGILNTNEWSDLYLADGGVIGWNNNDITLTHTANVLTLAGGNLVATFNAITLAGAVTGGDQAFTAVGDMTFTAGSILKSGSTNTNTLLIAANDTTFITLTTAATDTCDLAAAVTIGGAAIVTPASTATFTNKTFDANGTGNSLANVDVADLANGTDGELITWDANAAPATVAVGTSGQVLTSNGAGAAPTFQAAAAGTAPVFDRVVRTAGDVTTTSATLVDFTGATVTFTTGAFPVQFSQVGAVSTATAGHRTDFNVDLDSGTLMFGTSGHSVSGPVANYQADASFSGQTAALSAASHTIKLQWLVTAGTSTMQADSGRAHMWTAFEIR